MLAMIALSRLSLDANLTTFLVAMVLFTIGSGPVKGFAITLMIGIITSMFTAIVGTRASDQSDLRWTQS
jgi:preprotein translocase subunit SecD